MIQKKGKSTLSNFIPFSFPVIALFIIFSGGIGTFTITASVGVLLLGFIYSITLIIVKKGLVGAVINIYVIGIMIFGSALVYIMSIATSI